jgi:hypothetical protein
MAEEDVAVGRNVIEAVVVTICGRGPRRVDAERAVGDEQSIEAISQEINTHRGDDQPRGIDRFTPIERDDPE